MSRRFLCALAAACFLFSAGKAWPEVPEEASVRMREGFAAVDAAMTPQDLGNALRAFEDAARIAPDWADAFFNLAKVSATLDKPRRAIQGFVRYLELAPDASDAGQVREEIRRLETMRRWRKQSVSAGITFAALPSGIFVRNAFPGSLAAAGGLRKGDRIAAMDKKGTEGMTLFDFIGLVEGIPEKSKVPVEIVRGGNRVMVVMNAEALTDRSGKIREIEEADFEDEVLRSKTPVLAVFWASWCPHCVQFTPRLREVAASTREGVRFVTINVEENVVLAKRYTEGKIPTTVYFRDGQIVERVFGAVSKETLVDLLKK